MHGQLISTQHDFKIDLELCYKKKKNSSCIVWSEKWKGTGDGSTNHHSNNQIQNHEEEQKDQ